MAKIFNFLRAVLFICLSLVIGKSLAAEIPVFSGKISGEGGAFQVPGGSAQVYQYSRLLLQSHSDFTSSFSLDLAGEAHWQTSSGVFPPAWPLTLERSWVEVEADNRSDSNGDEFQSLRLSRAYLKWVSGSLEASAGLQNFNWGSSHFYQPTNYFYPLAPLGWERDQPLGSEAVDASCFLLDDLTLEGAVRWLEGGADEWVLRLVNKGIGITATPSFARLQGRNGMGLELSGTFPDFQLRVEGVDWLYPSTSSGQAPSAQLEWVLGISTFRKGVGYTLEIFRDETGRILGDASAGLTNATYLFTSMEKTFSDGWKVSPALVKGFEGGPLIFWPKVSWDFSQGWEASCQGQFRIGTVPGPLALAQNRCGVSIGFSF